MVYGDIGTSPLYALKECLAWGHSPHAVRPDSAAVLGVGGSLLAVAVPSFVENLSASRWSESTHALARVAHGALVHAMSHPHENAFPPSAPLTPEQTPRGERVQLPPEAWSHLSWRALGFSMDGPQAYAYRFDSALDPATRVFRFAATASSTCSRTLFFGSSSGSCGR